MFRVGVIFSAIVFIVPGVVLAATDTATINISATVRANTCTLSNKNPVFILPAVSTGDFSGLKGKVVSSAPVTISFTNCGADTKRFSVQMTGTQDTEINDGITFKNALSDSTAATGVGILLYGADGTIFRPDGTKTALITPPTGGGNVSVNYTAKYISTRGVVTSGKVSAVITAYIVYP